MSTLPTTFLFVFALLLCLLTPYICPSIPILPLAPISIAFGRRISGERRIDGVLAALVTLVYFSLINYPISLLFYFIPYHWCVLTAYSVFILVYNRHIFGIDNETVSHKVWFRIYMALFWDFPLLSAFKIVSYFGGQLSAPLITIIDENICVGALPFSTNNVLQLYGNPYHVRAVINLCHETCGPIKEYEKYKMRYIQLKTLDTTPPSVDSVTLGIQFIEDFVRWKQKENNGLGRVFIHCKGGRGRSVAMTVCWLLSQGHNANHAMNIIKSKRKVASSVVLGYNCVQHCVHKYEK